jgi:hypothetical protein
MVPVTPPDETAEKLVALVKQHLAQRLHASTFCADVKPVVGMQAWLSKPGIDYPDGTPGYTICSPGGKTIRINETKRLVQCKSKKNTFLVKQSPHDNP